MTKGERGKAKTSKVLRLWRFFKIRILTRLYANRFIKESENSALMCGKEEPNVSL